MNLWGMQVANLKTGQIITASLPDHPPGDAGLLHGIGWTPDQSEVWESSRSNDPHVYVWAIDDPMAPVLKQTLTLKSSDGTEIFNARTHTSLGRIDSTEDVIEIEFVDGKVSRVGDQYGIGRR